MIALETYFPDRQCGLQSSRTRARRDRLVLRHPARRAPWYRSQYEIERAEHVPPAQLVRRAELTDGPRVHQSGAGVQGDP